MENFIVGRACAALVLLSAGIASADTVQVGTGTSAGGSGSVPPSIGDVFGTLSSSGTNRGGNGPLTPDGPGMGNFADDSTIPVDPRDASPVGGNVFPSMVPLPTAVVSGLIGLAAVGIIGRLRRRALTH